MMKEEGTVAQKKQDLPFDVQRILDMLKGGNERRPTTKDAQTADMSDHHRQDQTVHHLTTEEMISLQETIAE